MSSNKSSTEKTNNVLQRLEASKLIKIFFSIALLKRFAEQIILVVIDDSFFGNCGFLCV